MLTTSLESEKKLSAAAPEAPVVPALFSCQTRYGTAKVYDHIPKHAQETWQRSLAGFDHDHRYYELTQSTLSDQFSHYYLFLIDETGQTQSIQPFFLVTHDLLEGLSPVFKRIADRLRQTVPYLFSVRMLMVGSPAGEGDLSRPISNRPAVWVAEALHEALPAIAKKLHASLIVLKDFPKSYRPVLDTFSSNGYVRMPSMPATELALKFNDFEHYVSSTLSHKTRKNIRKKLREVAALSPISMEVVPDLAPYIDEVYPLYQQVFHRAKLKFEELSRDYLLKLGQTMPERVRFFLWRQDGRIVAFNVCLVNNGVLYDKYIGLQYPIALEAHLYFLTLSDVMKWAMANDIHTYYSAPLNYDPKLHLRQKLVPLDLYTRHTSNWINPFVRRFIRFLGPTQHDQTLALFENFKDLE